MCGTLNTCSVSIIVPLYNEEKNIKELFLRISEALSSLNLLYEVIFIDDGSKDRTHYLLKEIRSQNINIKIIRLYKNFGQLFAFLVGFKFAKGEIILTMDGDLQNDPRDIPKFLVKIKEGFDLVSGWRYNRNDPLIRKIISKIYNWMVSKKTNRVLNDYGCAFTAAKKELIDKLKDYGENARFIKPLLASLANRAVEIRVSHYPRKKGISKYNLAKIIRLGADFLLNFTLDTHKVKKGNSFCIAEKIINE